MKTRIPCRQCHGRGKIRMRHKNRGKQHTDCLFCRGRGFLLPDSVTIPSAQRRPLRSRQLALKP